VGVPAFAVMGGAFLADHLGEREGARRSAPPSAETPADSPPPAGADVSWVRAADSVASVSKAGRQETRQGQQRKHLVHGQQGRVEGPVVVWVMAQGSVSPVLLGLSSAALYSFFLAPSELTSSSSFHRAHIGARPLHGPPGGRLSPAS